MSAGWGRSCSVSAVAAAAAAQEEAAQVQLSAEVRQAAKHNDPLAGLAAYDKAKAEGKPPANIDLEGDPWHQRSGLKLGRASALPHG